MVLSECCIQTDSRGQELARHGTDAFPVACYQDDFHIMNVPWHWHPEWEAVRIVQGSCTVAAGQERMTLQAGQGFFINSGVLHGCWDEALSGCVFHSLVFHPRLVGGSLDSALHQNYVLPLMENDGLEWLPLSPEIPWQCGALQAIERAWQSCFREEPGHEFSVRSALSDLTWALWQNMPISSPGRKTGRDDSRIKAMLSFLHSNFAELLTVRQIAASAAISESECLRCFRAAIGTSPIQYLKQYRLQQAAGMLSATDERICDIAAKCGFQDMSYFTRTFRKEKGCTPSEYRQRETRS